MGSPGNGASVVCEMMYDHNDDLQVPPMSRDLSQYEDRNYMADIEVALNRDRSTIRTWEREGWLPEALEFKRDEAGWRYWDNEQLEQAHKWLASRNPGRSRPRTSA